MNAQPVHNVNTPNHRPSVTKATKPSKPREKPTTHSTHRTPTRDDKKGGSKERNNKKGQKSAPLAERTVPIGSGARMSIASLGTLPATNRSH